MTTLEHADGRAAAGWGSASERLAAVAAMVRRMCVNRLGPWDGEDAAQDVLERLWRYQQRPEYTPAPLFGLAVGAVRFRVLQAHAGRRRVRVIPVGELTDRVWADPVAGPEAHLERKEAARDASRRVGELIGRLSLRERQVLLASGLGMRSNAQTAARLGIDRDTVSATKSRALARMREFAGCAPAGGMAARRRAAYAGRAGERGRSTRARGVRLPEEVHRAGEAAAGAGWTRRELAREFRVSSDTISRWTAAARAATAAPEGTGDRGPVDSTGGGGRPDVAELVARAHRAAAAVAERAAAVERAAAQRDGAGSGRVELPRGVALPDEVHRAGRAAVRAGWAARDLRAEFGVSDDTVARWRATASTNADDQTGEEADAGGGDSTEVLLARAHAALDGVRQRRAEVTALARRYGAARPGRGRGHAVPPEVHQPARDAVRAGWSVQELSQAFGVSRRTATRWRSQGPADPAQSPAGAQHVVGSGDGGGVEDEDPLVRARAAVDALSAATDRSGGIEDGASGVRDRPLGDGAESGMNPAGPRGAERVSDSGDPVERAREAVAAACLHTAASLEDGDASTARDGPLGDDHAEHDDDADAAGAA